MIISDDDVEAALRALASDRRLLIMEWLKHPKAHFRAQVDGDLASDGVCGVLIPEGHREAMRLLSSRVGKAKRAHHSRSRSHQWWARRKGRLCPPSFAHTLS